MSQRFGSGWSSANSYKSTKSNKSNKSNRSDKSDKKAAKERKERLERENNGYLHSTEDLLNNHTKNGMPHHGQKEQVIYKSIVSKLMFPELPDDLKRLAHLGF